MKNIEIFKETYAKNLVIAKNKYPNDYSWPDTEMASVLDRIFKAIDKMSFSKDSRAFKMTCKELKIKHTYSAIETFIKA